MEKPPTLNISQDEKRELQIFFESMFFDFK